MYTDWTIAFTGATHIHAVIEGYWFEPYLKGSFGCLNTLCKDRSSNDIPNYTDKICVHHVRHEYKDHITYTRHNKLTFTFTFTLYLYLLHECWVDVGHMNSPRPKLLSERLRHTLCRSHVANSDNELDRYHKLQAYIHLSISIPLPTPTYINTHLHTYILQCIYSHTQQNKHQAQ